MKKIYTIIIALLPFVSLAQPTITQSDLPFAGLGFTLASDSNYTSAILPGGAATTWDYSTLLNNYPDTAGFMDAAGTPYAGDYPTSNLASYSNTNGAWTYYTNDATGFYVDGFDTTGVSFRLDPGQLFTPVPFTYMDARSQTAHIQVDTVYLGINARVILSITSNFEADGYGTLILPNNTYTDVLRIKDTQVTTDSNFIDLSGTGNYTLYGTPTVNQLTFYKWYQHGASANLVLGIDADSLGTTGIKSSYLDQFIILSANNLVAANNAVSAYPNPATDVLHLNLAGINTKDATISVYNSLGATVGTYAVNNLNKFDLPLSNFENGIYFYSLTSGTEKRDGKFSVVH